MPTDMFSMLLMAATAEASWARMVADMSGYERKTTFYADFTIAEMVDGQNGVKDTYERAFNEWKNNTEYLTELVLVLNHKSWEHENDIDMCRLYDNLFRQAQEWGWENLKGKDLEYFYNTLD